MAAPSVVLVGLGNLGAPVATRLLELHWNVSVMDTEDSRVEELVSEGAQPAEPDAVAAADLLLFVVPGEPAIRAALDQLGGALPTLAVILSTLSPEAAVDVAQTLAARGVRMVEAPVSGGAERARKGELVVFVGGGSDDVADARPVLDALGSEVHHMGPIGAGAAAKLANQLVTFGTLGVVLEAMRLATAHGLNEDAVLRAFGSATGDTWVGRNWGFYDELTADYDRREVPSDDRPWNKDLAAIRTAAAARNVDVPITTELSRTLADSIDAHAKNGTGGAAQ